MEYLLQQVAQSIAMYKNRYPSLISAFTGIERRFRPIEL